MAAENERSVSIGTDVPRDGSSDITRRRSSAAPEKTTAPGGGPEAAPTPDHVSAAAASPLPRPPRTPSSVRHVVEVVERVERFDLRPVTPRASRPPSAPAPRATPSPEPRPQTSGGIPTPKGVGAAHEAPSSSSDPASQPSSAPPASRPPSYARPTPLTVDHVRTDLDALDSPSMTSDAPPPAADPVTTLLVELHRAAPGDVDQLGPRLRRWSAALLPELTRHFPGPTWFDRKLPHLRMPRASEASPLSAALVLLGADSTPHVEALLAHESPNVRFHAALVVTELREHTLLDSVAPLLLDDDLGVHQAARLAVEALRTSAAYPQVLVGLRRTAAQATAPQMSRVRSIDALADLGDPLALDVLVELLGDDDRAIARAAHDGLRRLTCHDLGTTRLAWRHWARSQGLRHRFDWLVDALEGRRPELRQRALNELRRISGRDFGVTDDAPRSAFIEAQPKFLRWWQAHVVTQAP